jgi:hypothetical protein
MLRFKGLSFARTPGSLHELHGIRAEMVRKGTGKGGDAVVSHGHGGLGHIHISFYQNIAGFLQVQLNGFRYRFGRGLDLRQLMGDLPHGLALFG